MQDNNQSNSAKSTSAILSVRGNEEIVKGDRVRLIKIDESLKVVEGFKVGQIGTVVDINEFSFRQYPMIEWDISVTVIGNILGVWKETRTNVCIKCLQKINL